MLTRASVNQHVTSQKSIQDHSELNRLLAAAVVSRQFRNMLLTNPSVAIKNGFAGEHFSLSTDEYEMVLSARSSTLPEFAQQVGKLFPVHQPITRLDLSEEIHLRI